MNDIKSILVHVDSSAACTMRLEVAHRLAEQYDAGVTAAYAATPSPIEFPTGFSGAADVAGMMLQFDRDRRDRARATFEAAVASGLPRMAWSELEGEPTYAFAREALYADLIVAGQHDPRPTTSDVPPDFVESVLIASGVPALVVPYIGAPATIGRTVLVAWKESRESAHALSAALPMLEAADRVHVALWRRVGEPGDEGERLAARLRRHDIQVTLHRQGEESRDIGEQLISLVSDCSADLLVMGCYGHSRAREWMLGGATRAVLGSMTVPVLMAH